MNPAWIVLAAFVLAAGGWFGFLRKPDMAKLAKKDPKKFLKRLTVFKGLSPEDLGVGRDERLQPRPGEVTRLEATPSSRIIWFARYPGFVARA